MLIRLADASVESMVEAVFDHDVPAEGGEPWYFGGRVRFEIDVLRQLDLLAELFRNSRSLLAGYSSDQIEQGLWCILGGAHCESFTGLVWNPALPFDPRSEVIASTYDLYGELLAQYPFEAIDFRHPDAIPRRFGTIDYMAPDLLLARPWFPQPDAKDQAEVRGSFLELFARLLAHEAPVAQYAALHGLGHLGHDDGPELIDRFLAEHPWLESDQRAYALAARCGDVL